MDAKAGSLEQTGAASLETPHQSRAKQQLSRRLWTARAVHTLLFCGVLFAFGVFSLLLPRQTRSEIERRDLADMPEFSAQALTQGSYTKDLELFYADTFPLRELFVSVAAALEELRGVRYDGVRIHGAQPPSEQPPEVYQTVVAPPVAGQDTAADPDPLPGQLEEGRPTPHTVEDDGATGEKNGAVFVYKNKAMSIFGGSDSMGEWYAKTIKAYQDVWGDGVQVYDMVIPTAIEFALPQRYKSVSSPQRPNIEHIYDNLGGKVKGVDAYGAIEAHADEYLYFNADHHWTALGAYYAYQAFAQEAELESLVLSQYEKRSIEGFYGTMYAQTSDLRLAEDVVDYYLMPVESTAVRYDTDAPYAPNPHSVWAEYAKGGNSYSVFFHGDYPLIRVDTANQNGKKILVVKESFGNAFAPFLIPHYQQVYVVDQRYFQLGLADFVRRNGIQEVVFINNIFAANTAYHIRKIEGMMYQQFVPPALPEPEPAPAAGQSEVEAGQPEAEAEADSHSLPAQSGTPTPLPGEEQAGISIRRN